MCVCVCVCARACVCKSKHGDKSNTKKVDTRKSPNNIQYKKAGDQFGWCQSTLDCQMLPTERLNDISDNSDNISESSITYQQIILSYKCIVCCAVRATGSGAVCVTAGRYVTPMSSHCHCDTNLYVCRAGGERAVRFTAILIWNYYCDHFVFVATIADSAPHDVNQITGRGQVTWVLMTLRREVQDF